MKQKSLGQVAYDARFPGGFLWSDITTQKEWETVAQAVIREYMKRKNAKKKIKVEKK